MFSIPNNRKTYWQTLTSDVSKQTRKMSNKAFPKHKLNLINSLLFNVFNVSEINVSEYKTYNVFHCRMKYNVMVYHFAPSKRKKRLHLNAPTEFVVQPNYVRRANASLNSRIVKTFVQKAVRDHCDKYFNTFNSVRTTL